MAPSRSQPIFLGLKVQVLDYRKRFAALQLAEDRRLLDRQVGFGGTLSGVTG